MEIDEEKSPERVGDDLQLRKLTENWELGLYSSILNWTKRVCIN